jgi:flagellar biosynthesis protein FlhG
VVSGKGGVGKSNISLNLAIELSQAGKRVLLMDGDLGMANLDILAGVSSAYTLLDYFQEGTPLSKILIEYQKDLSILPGGSGLVTLLPEAHDTIRVFVESLVQEGNYDIILIDAGAGVDAKLLSFVSFSHEVLLVTVPEPTALADAYSLVKVLSVYGIKDRIHLIVNQVTGPKEARETYQRLNKVIGTFLKVQVCDLGYVHTDKKVKEAVLRQKPFTTLFPMATASKNVRSISGKLLNPDQEMGVSTFGDAVLRFMKVFGS